ncbi:YugN-like family protein [Shouchella shacheensis]|uniref:YugN-like family protein n=1 Tax=Shouchella shacheensis TaxID=1649580 RepID=UPI00073FCB98|nr:YugN-like family protein [Shouchella shacheensis]
MIELSSAVEGKTFKCQEVEKTLRQLGYTMGGNWDYDHGCFDYKISEEDGYTFLRLPFSAIDGEIGTRGATVQLGAPYLLHHVYQKGTGQDPDIGLIPEVADGLINQFQSPVEKDGEVDEKYMTVARNLVQELEETLLH